jgi:hypothetical protein
MKTYTLRIAQNFGGTYHKVEWSGRYPKDAARSYANTIGSLGMINFLWKLGATRPTTFHVMGTSGAQFFITVLKGDN